VVEFLKASRVMIIADTAVERKLLEEILRLGIKGHNCPHCFGKGRHETVEDPMSGRSRVRIEVVTQAATAASILEFVHHKQFGNYPIAAFADRVDVDRRDKFY
jgi:hypothetical protein